MDDLEKELLSYDNMETSIEKIKNPGIENKELFRDLNTFKTETGTCGKSCSAAVNNKNFDMSNFVQDLEENLDNFDNLQTTSGPAPSNIDFNKQKENFLENLVNIEPDYENEEEQEESSTDSLNRNIHELLVKIKEPLMVILLFILLNNPDLIALIYQLPIIKDFNSQYPSLIIRGILLAVIIYYLRKLDNK